MSNTEEIIRRPDYASGPLTEEEKVKMEAHTKKWIGYATRTDNINPDLIVPALRGLYTEAKLNQPRVVIVSSPFVMAVASSMASVVWQRREETPDFARPLPDLPAALTDNAQACGAYYALVAATTGDDRTGYVDARYEASDKAAVASVRDLRWVRQFASAMASGDSALTKAYIDALPTWWRMYQGGNLWAAWDCYLTAGRDVLGLRLPAHEPYKPWEQAAINGGFRAMHEEFCIVTDFPDILTMDNEQRPHNENGPSHRWRDGYALYHWHGTRVLKPHVIETPEKITVDEITQETNAELRRIMITRYGVTRYLIDAGAEVVHKDRFGVLYRKLEPDDEPIAMVRVLNSTPEPEGTLTRDEALAIFDPDTRVQQGYTSGEFDATVTPDEAEAAMKMVRLADADPSLRFKEYMIPVHHELRPLLENGQLGKAQRERTARNAVASTFGMTGDEYDPVFES